MQHCSACQKAFATIHILDLQDGVIVDQKHLCASCAENAGMVQQKATPLQMQQDEMLSLIGQIKMSDTETSGTEETLACPACHLTTAEFRVRGRLGCPRCYEVFKSALLPLLERVHDATSHRGRFPGGDPAAPVISNRSEVLIRLRERLDVAISTENYEEAAAIRDQIRVEEKPKAEQPPQQAADEEAP